MSDSLEQACSRRDFFKLAFDGLRSVAVEAASGALAAAEAFAPKPAKAHKPFVRPPGAVEESRFLELCTRCDDCVKACGHWVVRRAGPEFGARQEGTPVLLPAENPCLFCVGLPCASACKTGALVAPPVPRPRIGRAVVDAGRCYMGQGQPCDYCVKYCPRGPKAVRLGSPGTAAAIDPELCDGCGKCAQTCPVNAITIEAHR